MVKYILDVKRLLCPLPVIRTQDKVKIMKSGDVLEIVCTDPGSMQDIPAWCRINGHKVLKSVVEDAEYSITLEVR